MACISMKKWIQKKTKVLLKRPIFSVSDVECFHPEKEVSHTFFRLSTRDWINVVAVDKEGSFIMVRQHRLGTDTITLETVGGMIDANEPPLEAARRELLEETGYAAGTMHHLKSMAVNPAIMDNHIHVFFAENCTPTSEQNLDAAEDIEVLLFSRDRLAEMIRNGELDHSIAITSLALYWLSAHCSDRTTL